MKGLLTLTLLLAAGVEGFAPARPLRAATVAFGEKGGKEVKKPKKTAPAKGGPVPEAAKAPPAKAAPKKK